MLVRISIVTRVTIYFVTTVTQLPAPTSANVTENIRYNTYIPIPTPNELPGIP